MTGKRVGLCHFSCWQTLYLFTVFDAIQQQDPEMQAFPVGPPLRNLMNTKGFGFYDPHRDLDLHYWLDIQEDSAELIGEIKTHEQDMQDELNASGRIVAPELRDSFRRRNLIVRKLNNLLNEVSKRGPYDKFDPTYAVYRNYARLDNGNRTFPKLDPDAPRWSSQQLDQFRKTLQELREEYEKECEDYDLNEYLDAQSREPLTKLFLAANKYVKEGEEKINSFVSENEREYGGLAPKAEELAAEGDEALDEIRKWRVEASSHPSRGRDLQALKSLTDKLYKSTDQLHRVETDIDGYDVSGGRIGKILTGSRKLLAAPQVRKHTRVKFH